MIFAIVPITYRPNIFAINIKLHEALIIYMCDVYVI